MTLRYFERQNAARCGLFKWIGSPNVAQKSQLVIIVGEFS